MDTHGLCAAPNCQEPRLGKSVHCKVHLKKFSSAYAQYKQFSSRIQKYLDRPELLESKSPSQLMAIADKFRLTANLRRDYQLMAFKPQYHDEGHGQIIDRMRSMSDRLLKLLVKEVDDTSDGESDKEGDEEESNEPTGVRREKDRLIPDLLKIHQELEQEYQSCMATVSGVLSILSYDLCLFVELINGALSLDDLREFDEYDPGEVEVLAQCYTVDLMLSKVLSYQQINYLPQGILSPPKSYEPNTEQAMRDLAGNIYRGNLPHPLDVFVASPHQELLMKLLGHLIAQVRRQPLGFYFRFKWREAGDTIVEDIGTGVELEFVYSDLGSVAAGTIVSVLPGTGRGRCVKSRSSHKFFNRK